MANLAPGPACVAPRSPDNGANGHDGKAAFRRVVTRTSYLDRRPPREFVPAARAAGRLPFIQACAPGNGEDFFAFRAMHAFAPQPMELADRKGILCTF
ncbi:hypothetical protein IPC413_22000 [Pseudomonas aeruginosa]|nr:hypothetical protein [Pseudomonas aeruginosa]MBK3766422.1 hypothetical protein [Pseudomonas aeruginosa]MBK3772439.1 hypothetical protein [Pseudomonas aeruginosa]MBK3793150.1 hypothetical protein [Pseudomonas aeruginosa]MBK3886741.1 hypothetical protein [Pseudomonas aeruginosa]